MVRPGARPVYRAIAASLADDIRQGRLAPGSRLPTHRELAAALGVTVGTASRAYAQAHRWGIIDSRVGRGTFVRGVAASSGEAEAQDLVDMSCNFPPHMNGAERLRRTLAEIAAPDTVSDLLAYQPSGGAARHRAAGAAWLSRTGLPAEADTTLVTAGAQHALTVLSATLLRPGDQVLAEEMTYPGMKALAGMLGLRMEGLPSDSEGLSAEALERACRESPARALYTIPTIQNPTGTMMSERRRREIAAIARAHDLLVIEDDIHALLPDDAPPPIAAFHPAGSFYVASLAKTVSPGLRIGFLHAPPEYVDRLAAGIRTTIWMASPLTAEVAAHWIESGVADGVLAEIRHEAEARQALARERLGGFDFSAHPSAFHVWLPLPHPWRGSEFVASAERRGIRISGAEAFALGPGIPPDAVRVCLGAPRNRASLTRALDVIRELLAAGPESGLPVM
jgi:DNA-binding transcriptional MocR family regulator